MSYGKGYAFLAAIVFGIIGYSASSTAQEAPMTDKIDPKLQDAKPEVVLHSLAPLTNNFGDFSAGATISPIMMFFQAQSTNEDGDIYRLKAVTDDQWACIKTQLQSLSEFLHSSEGLKVLSSHPDLNTINIHFDDQHMNFGGFVNVMPSAQIDTMPGMGGVLNGLGRMGYGKNSNQMLSLNFGFANGKCASLDAAGLDQALSAKERAVVDRIDQVIQGLNAAPTISANSVDEGRVKMKCMPYESVQPIPGFPGCVWVDVLPKGEQEHKSPNGQRIF